MKSTKRCSECSGTDIRTRRVNAYGQSGNLLPKIGGFWTGAELEIYVCVTCGHYQMFVSAKHLAEIKEKYEPYR